MYESEYAIIFLSKKKGVVSVRGDSLYTVEDDLVKGLDIGVVTHICFQPHAFHLLDHRVKG